MRKRLIPLAVLALLGLAVLSEDLSAAEEVSMHCYYGDDGNGNPTAVATIDVGDSCAGGTSSQCIGSMSACDCAVGFTNC